MKMLPIRTYRMVALLLVSSASLLACSQADDTKGIAEPSTSETSTEVSDVEKQNEFTWWRAGAGRELPEISDYNNSFGKLRVQLSGETLQTEGHAFFEPIGSNGRACVTCHQPADSMSLSVESARNQWRENGANDPLFSAFDGANCPHLPQENRSSHSLLLDHGLIRIPRAWPPVGLNGKEVEVDFTLEVIRDPWGCNSAPNYGVEEKIISVYRRPRPIANMKYLLAIGFEGDPKLGMPVPVDPVTVKPTSGNLLADRRQLTLEGQMQEAAQGHLEMAGILTAEQGAQIKNFMLRIYTAQVEGRHDVRLDAGGANGGPDYLAVSKPGQLGSIGKAVWSEFEAWENMSVADKNGLTKEQIEYRLSVARGARVFREKMFLITDSAGINSPVGFGNPVLNSCVFCHNMSMMGNDVAPGQVDLGTTTLPFADPAPHLPLFKITCQADPHPHYGREILTNDPGYALTTGRCADVGKITLQSLRGLAARAPYFSNGSAKTIAEIIEYYERRYSIGYTEQEKQDLINLMGAL